VLTRRGIRWALLFALLIALTSTTASVTRAAPLSTNAPTTPALSGVVRYSNAAQGYSLLIPTRWGRVRDVRWTPDGVPADLTIVTPDHQALLGALAAPTGGRAYNDAELQQVGDDLIDQQDAVQGNEIQHRRVVINHVAFQASIATFRHGGETQADSWMAVLTTVRHRRLYAFAGLVYDRTIHFVRSGGSGNNNGEPTATPTDVPLGPLDAQPYGQRRGSISSRVGARIAGPSALVATIGGGSARTVGGDPRMPGRPLPGPAIGPAIGAQPTVPTGAAVEVSRQGRSAAAATPTLPVIDRPGHNACATLFDHQNPVVIDKNCGFGAERLLIAASFASIVIDPRAGDDPRPAPAVGVDGFARHVNAGAGYAIGYPAQWTPLKAGAPGADFAIRAPDHKAILYVAVGPAGASPYSSADLRTLADHELEQTGQLLGKITHHALTGTGGALVALADDSDVDLDLGGGATAQTRVTALVGLYHRRLYAVVAVVYHVGGGPDDFNDVQARFFAPFDAVARQAGAENYDAHDRAQQLALASLASLDLDPQLGVDPRPVPAVGVDGFTRHVDTSDGYSIRYPAAWTQVAGQGVDLSVRSPDKRVALAVVVQPAGDKAYFAADLRAVADREIGQIGQVSSSAIAYTTTVTSDGTAELAIANEVTVPTCAFGTEQATVTVAVVARRHRLYGALGVVRVSSTDNPADADYTRSETNQQLVLASLATVAFDPRVGDDPRPAPAVGIDGFTRHVGDARGYAISYPAAWMPVSNAGADLTLRSPDKDAILAVAVVPTNGKDYSDADLRGLADGQIRQVGLPEGGIAHGTARVGGVTYQTAVADVSTSGGGLGAVGAMAHMIVLATVYDGRVYGFLAVVVRSNGPGNNNPRYDIDSQLVGLSFNTITLG